LWQVGLLLPPKNGNRPPERTRRQLELSLDHPYERLRFADLHDAERMLAEYQMLGFAAAGHPFRLVRHALPADVVSSGRFPELASGARCRVSGLVVARQRPQTAKGFIFVLMEDEAGMINVIVRPDVYDRCRAAVRGEPFLLVEGTLQKDGATMNVIAEEVEALKLNAKFEMRNAKSKNEHNISHFEFRNSHSPWQFLRAMRTVAPDSKDWG
jgi:error-prone DNA polymerase